VTPPRSALWLLSRRLDRDTFEAISGDLTEEFDRRATLRPVLARAWFWRQTVATLLAWRTPRPTLGAGRAPDASRQWLGGARLDVRIAVRQLWRAPGFSLTAIVTLGIAVSLNTAVFSVVRPVLLDRLPFPSSDQLVVLGELQNATISTIGYATFDDWRARMSNLATLAALGSWAPALATDSGAERLNGMRVTHEFFALLGIPPALGRGFAPSDDVYERSTVVMISDRLWRSQFDADPRAIGTRVRLDGVDHEIVGVMPASFEPIVSAQFYQPADVWTPLGYDPSRSVACRTCRHLRVIGRLHAGVTLAQASATLETVHGQLRQANESQLRGSRAGIESLQDRVTRPVRRPLALLQGAAMLVLVVACANLASLMLARATSRRNELAVRAALGASRGRLVRQQLIEALVLSGLSAACGLALAAVWSRSLLALAPPTLPRMSQVSLDWTAWLFSVAIAGGSAVAFALAPALRSARTAAGSEGLRTTARRATLRLRELLIVADLSVALVLIVSAALMIASLRNLLVVSPGFDPIGVSTFQMSLVGPRWAADDAVRAFHEELLVRISSRADVEAAALSGQIPLGGNRDSWGASIQGRLEDNEAELERYSVTPDYFKAMRIPLMEGRLIEPTDATTSEAVALVSQEAVRQYWAGSSPIGSRIRIGPRDGPWRTVVGVVGDVRHAQLDAPPTPQMYLPQSQLTDSFIVLSIRGPVAFPVALQHVRSTVRDLAASVPVYSSSPYVDLVARSAAPRRFLALVLVGFSACALVLTTVGLYGVAAYAVARRAREVGIRIALGASPGSVRWMLLRRGLALAAVGLLPGTGAALGATRLLESQLFGVAPHDMSVLLAAACLLLVVVLAAHVVPLRRAARIAPSTALRSE